MEKKSKNERIAVVNEIMNEISLHDRRFFYNKKNDVTASISVDEKTGKFWYNSESHYESSPKKICLSVKDGGKQYGFPHGGTIWGLVKDFCEYIRTGNHCNGENGYGGLYCPHWGYTEEAMVKIQQKAKQLGYLN